MSDTPTPQISPTPEQRIRMLVLASLAPFNRELPSHWCRGDFLHQTCQKAGGDVPERDLRIAIASLTQAGLVVERAGRTTAKLEESFFAFPIWFTALVIHIFAKGKNGESAMPALPAAIDEVEYIRRVRFIQNRALTHRTGKLICRFCETTHNTEKALEQHLKRWHGEQIKALAAEKFQ